MPSSDTERIDDLTNRVRALEAASSTVDKIAAWLAPYLPWLKSVAAWAVIYAGGFASSHYGAPQVKEVPGPARVEYRDAPKDMPMATDKPKPKE